MSRSLVSKSCRRVLTVLAASSALGVLAAAPALGAPAWSAPIPLGVTDESDASAVGPDGHTLVGWSFRNQMYVRSISPAGKPGATRRIGPGDLIAVARSSRGVGVAVGFLDREVVVRRSSDGWRAHRIQGADSLRELAPTADGEAIGVFETPGLRIIVCRLIGARPSCLPPAKPSIEDAFVEPAVPIGGGWLLPGETTALRLKASDGTLAALPSSYEPRPGVAVDPDRGALAFGDARVDALGSRIAYTAVDPDLWGDAGPRGQIVYGTGTFEGGLGRLQRVPGVGSNRGIRPQIALLPAGGAVVAWLDKTANGFSSWGTPRWIIVDAGGEITRRGRVATTIAINPSLVRTGARALLTWENQRGTQRVHGRLIDANRDRLVGPAGGLPVQIRDVWSGYVTVPRGGPAAGVVVRDRSDRLTYRRLMP